MIDDTQDVISQLDVWVLHHSVGDHAENNALIFLRNHAQTIRKALKIASEMQKHGVGAKEIRQLLNVQYALQGKIDAIAQTLPPAPEGE